MSQKYILTPGDGVKGSRAARLARRAELRLRKKALKVAADAQTAGLIKTALQSPVISGTVAYLGVSAIQSLITAYVAEKASSATSSGPGPHGGNITGQGGLGGTMPAAQSLPPAQEFLVTFLGLLGPVSPLLSLLGVNPIGAAQGNAVQAAAQNSGLTLSALMGNADFTALKVSILLYIASGGNLAGLLTSTGGLISSLVSSAGLAEAGA
jgi:hypothetical protein